ncbi:MAG: hypothetical protein JWO82_46, partial [Akkermansiaceae bacterium]|nr:hypothetical protein [Akkermansiaceae bacterium]
MNPNREWTRMDAKSGIQQAQFAFTGRFMDRKYSRPFASIRGCSPLLTLALLAVVPLHAADKVTYEDQVLPIFQQSCLNCHNPDKAKGGLDLSSFSGAMKGSSGGKVVEPGDTGSKLLACVMQTSDKKMPPE